MTVDDLATTYSAFQTADKSVFQRRARTLQSMWRQERGYDCGTHKARPLGSLLEKTWAEETLSNFLTDRIKDVVRSDVLDRDKSRGKFINKPRPVFVNEVVRSIMQPDAQIRSRLVTVDLG